MKSQIITSLFIMYIFAFQFEKTDMYKNEDFIQISSQSVEIGCTTWQSLWCKENEKPSHLVSLSSLEIGKYEITNEQYTFFLNNIDTSKEIVNSWISFKDEETLGEKCRIEYINGSYKTEKGYDRYPIVSVSWYGAVAYCKWLSNVDKSMQYRLPTEAEWEAIARLGKANQNDKTYGLVHNVDSLPFFANFCGKECEQSWKTDNLYFSDNFTYLAPVGSKLPNEYGIYDLIGNVAEWCLDIDTIFIQNKLLNSNILKPVRGGSWLSSSTECRVSARSIIQSKFYSVYVGFRVVRVPILHKIPK